MRYAEAAAREVALLQWVESQPASDLWNADDARWATALARATPGGELQRERARHAARRLGERDERLAAHLHRAYWSPRWVLRAALLGLLLGAGLERLGGPQMNLLALPLWGVLALQLLGYALLVAAALGGWKLERLSAWWQRWLARGAGGERERAVLLHWLRISQPLQAARAALLWHAALLALSLGLIAGLYARGLQREYVIGWESSFLEAAQVQRLADTVLAPASVFSGLTVPKVAGLRHGAAQAPHTPAAPWLHLLALTVALVALPRVALLASNALRAAVLARALPVGGGPRELRLAVIGAGAGRFSKNGELLSSPEGDRLFVTLLREPPAAPSRWKPAAPRFDLVLDAAALPAPDTGWPTALTALRRLEWPARLRPAWTRLLAAWETEEQARTEAAATLIAEALAEMLALRVDIPDPDSAPALLQQALQPLLDDAEARMRALYEREPAAGEAAPQAPLALQLPLARGKSALLGSVVGGALVGLKADLATGGLTLGGGALTGALVGGLGAAGLSDWLNRKLDRRSARVQLDASALPVLARALLERWLRLLPHEVEALQMEAALAQTWVLEGPPEERALRLRPALLAAARALTTQAPASARADP